MEVNDVHTAVLRVRRKYKYKTRTNKLKEETGKRTSEQACCTFNGSPFGLPPQQPPAIDLVLLITAHHSKWDHLLFEG